MAGEIRFREVSADWGIDFRHHHGGSGERYMVETMVGGVVVFDYDGDGDHDLFFVDGGRLPGYQGEEPRSRLFRNDGAIDGPRFVDVTDRSGIEVAHYGSGATAGDVDGDGDLDLYVTQLGANQLFVNRGDGTFEDKTAEAGVGDRRWSASAAFSDVDRDGDLDLYVANYVDFSLTNHKFCGKEQEDIRAYCHPGAYNGVPDRFYRNRGDGTFDDATDDAGLTESGGAGLGVIFTDVDGDGAPDLYVANDETPNFLYHNRGDGTFEDVSLFSGTAYSDRGRPEAGMGVDAGDADSDGEVELVVTNFELETNALYSHRGSMLFLDARYSSGLAEPSLPYLAFGTAFADLDHDGDLDLLVANGHILDNAPLFTDGGRYAQENQVFENLSTPGRLRFRELKGTGLDEVRVSRGLAVGDLDGDGDLDTVINNSNQAAEVYENLAGSGAGGWLAVELAGTRSNRSGIGARLELVTRNTASGSSTEPPADGAGGSVRAPAEAAHDSGRRQLRERRTASSYLSQNALTVHFGLGSLERARSLVVRWPGGKVEEHRDLPARRRLWVRE